MSSRAISGILSLACVLACASKAAHAAETETAPPFKIAGKSSQAIQKYTGLTWLAQESLSLGSSLAAKCLLGGHPRVKVRAYSLSDCLSAKFKSISVDLKDCSYKHVPLADLKLQTSTPLQFNLFKSKKSNAGVAAPVMVAVSGEIDEKDVSAALQSPRISSELNFLRLQIPGLGDQHLQVLEPKVKIENGLLKIHTTLITAGAAKDTGVEMDISASPYLESERFIMLKNTKVESTELSNPEEFSKFSQDLLNPLLDFGKFDRKTHAFRLTQLDLSEQKLHFAGKLLLVPKPVPDSAKAKISQK
ncbi:MAG: hypothetical protein K2X27_06565 [Candidatus Obscuribacterales bacterium]|nr:hypothetical protein [Candidatus Obscuribacterales bacterium]